MKLVVRFALMIPFACAVLSTAAQMPKAAAPAKSPMQHAVDRFATKAKGVRIVGGSDARWEDNQWQVALVYAKDSNNVRAQFCGGSIIAPGWVVTAAHCMDDKFDASDYAVLSSTDNLKSGGKRSRVTAFKVHEGCNGGSA